MYSRIEVVMIKLLIGTLAIVSLSGCASWGTTKAKATASLCGQPFELEYADGKERDGLTIDVTCADGSKMSLSTSGTKAFEGQANAAGLAGQIAGAAVAAALSTVRPGALPENVTQSPE